MSSMNQPEFLSGATFEVGDLAGEPNGAEIRVGPLESGYGHTLGNALRRVLLSSLPGCAIVEVKVHVDGSPLEHEYSAVAGISEDMLDVMLNLRQIVLRNDTAEEQVLRLSVKGPKTVVAGDFQAPVGITIVNPEAEVCVITDEITLEIEATARDGRGYESAQSRFVNREDMEPATTFAIQLNSSFSPVRRVSYSVKQTQLHQRVDLDSMVMEVVTNGATTPKEAVVQSAFLLQQLFGLLTGRFEVSDPRMQRSIGELGFDGNVKGALARLNIHTLGDLIACTPTSLMQSPQIGASRIRVIEERLTELEFSLKSENEDAS